MLSVTIEIIIANLNLLDAKEEYDLTDKILKELGVDVSSTSSGTK